MSERYRGFRWPTTSQRLLLRAATGDAATAGKAWETWLATNSLDGIDGASQRLIPQIAQNLHRHGIETADAARLKGLLHRAWYENKLALHSASEAVGALRSGGLESMLLKGGALLAMNAGRGAARSMGDIDLLVHEDEAPKAVTLLTEAGWKYAHGGREGAIAALRMLHAVELRSASGQPLDLHRSMLEDNPRRGADRGAWRRSKEVLLDATSVRVPSPEDLLVAVCIHGTRATPGPTVRWVLDSLDLIRTEGGMIDWELVVRIARARRCTLAMSEALGFIREECEGGEVPARALRSLSQARRGWLERVDYHAQGAKDRAGWAVASSFSRHLRQTSGGGRVQAIAGFPQFFQYLWGLESAQQVPGEGFRRLRRHLGGRHPLRAHRG